MDDVHQLTSDCHRVWVLEHVPPAILGWVRLDDVGSKLNRLSQERNHSFGIATEHGPNALAV